MFSTPNVKPGVCAKCHGSGRWYWGAVVNGQPTKEGPCFACKGSGRQRKADIARNHAFNRYQVGRIVSGDTW